MDLRDCQRLASLVARTRSEPSDPTREIQGLAEQLGRLATEILASENNGSRGRTGPASLAETLSVAVVRLAGLANAFGIDLAENVETHRGAFFAHHPDLRDAEAPPVVPERIQSVTVYAASSQQAPPAYLEAAHELGRLIALEGWTAVYGGGSIGLMGALSRGVRAERGRIVGIILDRFITSGASDGEVPDMKTVSTMRSRKRGLEEAGDAFICLPGGLGTLEELFETMSFRHLGFHHKPVVLCNVAGFWDHALAQLERCFADRLIPESSRPTFQVADTPAAALDVLRAWSPPAHLRASEAAELEGQVPRTR